MTKQELKALIERIDRVKAREYMLRAAYTSEAVLKDKDPRRYEELTETRNLLAELQEKLKEVTA